MEAGSEETRQTQEDIAILAHLHSKTANASLKESNILVSTAREGPKRRHSARRTKYKDLLFREHLQCMQYHRSDGHYKRTSIEDVVIIQILSLSFSSSLSSSWPHRPIFTHTMRAVGVIFVSALCMQVHGYNAQQLLGSLDLSGSSYKCDNGNLTELLSHSIRLTLFSRCEAFDCMR
jgi:hypothetical protein